LANIYHKNINLDEYLVSEKLDGVRAYWDGDNFISRQGNIIKAPKCFVENFPKTHLEGELWIARSQFDLVSSIVRKENSTCEDWQDIKFMLFDMPKEDISFAERFEKMKELAIKTNLKQLQVIDQFRVSSHQDLEKKLIEITSQGAEGLMLHKINSFYQKTRNDDVLKYKTYQDDEAQIIDHIAGKGKYSGMLGAILVKNSDGVVFKIGTGFSDQQRRNPPKIGSIITYKFFGKTKNNQPRFASFVRERE
jgi:DNA ligase-1